MVASATAAISGAMTATIERRLALRKRARADGASGRPKSDEDGPTAAELEIAAAIDAECAPLLAERALIAAQLEQARRRAGAPAPDFALTASQSLLPLQQIEARHRGALAALRGRAVAERADVETFRRREDRVFGAKLPDSSLLSTGLLVTLMAVEAIASAPIFATANDTGLVNGYVTAIIMSALNATVGFLGGFFGVRYTTHSKPIPKTLGYLAALLSVVVAVGFNVFMAWWRADAAEPASGADATSWTSLLASGPSITLLMLGGIVFLMSLYEGATKFGETYPEYGKFERHAQNAEEEFRDALDELIGEMHAIVDPVIEKINTKVDALQISVSRMLSDYDEAVGRVVDLDAKLRGLSATHLALVTLYRHENAAARKGAPPRAFLTPPPPAAAPPDVLERAGVLLSDAKAAFSVAQASANKEIGDLIRALQDTSVRLEGAGADGRGA